MITSANTITIVALINLARFTDLLIRIYQSLSQLQICVIKLILREKTKSAKKKFEQRCFKFKRKKSIQT